MKGIFTVCFLTFFYTGMAQTEMTSFYFATPSDPGNGFLAAVPDDFFGLYQKETDSTSLLKITSDTVFSSMIFFASSTVSEFEEKETWSFNESYVFGILKGDSLPYIRSNDTLFYAIPLDRPLFAVKDVKLAQFNNTLLIYIPAHKGYWSLLTLEKTDDRVTIGSFDHEPVIEQLISWKKIETREMGGLKTYIAEPEKTEIQEVLKNKKAFEDREIYIRLTD